MSNAAHIQKLHPSIRSKVSAFLDLAADNGINLKITSSVRSMEEQAKLYAQGRTAPGQKVTNAKPGSSYHNFALAIDVVEIRDGKAIWDKGAKWDEIGRLGKQCGLRWGGDFKSLVDKPHFESGPNLAALNAKYNGGLLDAEGYIKNIVA